MQFRKGWNQKFTVSVKFTEITFSTTTNYQITSTWQMSLQKFQDHTRDKMQSMSLQFLKVAVHAYCSLYKETESQLNVYREGLIFKGSWLMGFFWTMVIFAKIQDYRLRVYICILSKNANYSILTTNGHNSKVTKCKNKKTLGCLDSVAKYYL